MILFFFVENEKPLFNKKEISLFGCADWQALICELDGVRPNTKFMEDEICIMCHLSKESIKYKYLLNPTEFFSITKSIRDFPKALLSSLPLDKRRYCWMHGISCILSNTCKLLYESLPLWSRKKSIFQSTMKTVFKGWNLAYYSLFPSSMKEFFK